MLSGKSPWEPVASGLFFVPRCNSPWHLLDAVDIETEEISHEFVENEVVLTLVANAPCHHLSSDTEDIQLAVFQDGFCFLGAPNTHPLRMWPFFPRGNQPATHRTTAALING